MGLRPRNGISLCSGGGGIELGLALAEPDFRCRCFVEWDKAAQACLVGNMGRTGPFHQAPVWDDVRTFVGDGWRGHIDLVSAGYPCQPFSAAGQRAGADDPRHLWPDVARVLWETGAEWGFFENVAGHISLGLETVLRDLWEMGWTPAVGLFSSAETGNSHERQRVFIVAHRDHGGGNVGNSDAHADPRGVDRGSVDGSAREGQGQSEQRQRVRLGAGGAGGNVDHPASPRCDTEGQRSEAHQQGGQRLSGAGRDDMDHASGAERQGIERGQRDAGGWQEQDGHSALRSGAGLCPPSPGDAIAWGHILRMAPDLAPAIAFRDLVSRSNDLAAMVAEGRVAETQAVAHLRVPLDAMANRPRQLRMLGNGVDPLVAAYAWRTLSLAHGLESINLERYAQ